METPAAETLSNCDPHAGTLPNVLDSTRWKGVMRANIPACLAPFVTQEFDSHSTSEIRNGNFGTHFVENNKLDPNKSVVFYFVNNTRDLCAILVGAQTNDKSGFAEYCFVPMSRGMTRAASTDANPRRCTSGVMERRNSVSLVKN